MASTTDHKPPPAENVHQVSAELSDQGIDLEKDAAVTCDVLCSLGSCSPPVDEKSETPASGDAAGMKRKASKTCPKQLQLPMFLSKTYHMIDRCDTDIATWSENGDSFIVKSVEKFASTVLPKYFKHSNFSSFARQLNFYGFRKLRSETILTADVDEKTSCYVRFFHENFRKNQPELLHRIKRATKTDQQSRDDLETLKQEVAKLKETLAATTADYDRKLAELSYECNRRISAMNAEYDKLATLVQSAFGAGNVATAASALAPASLQGSVAAAPDLLHSLSQAAVSLQSHLRPPQMSLTTTTAQAPVPTSTTTAPNANEGSGSKRQAPESSTNGRDGQPALTRARVS